VRVHFTDYGWEDYRSWAESDGDTLARINDLIEDIRRHPFIGIGKPEPLKGPLRGFWSRRITKEHRLVYCVEGAGTDQRVVIAQCFYHY
jgi:toxin YoeB